MDKVIGAVAQIGEIKVRNDDDFIDRLSRRYTTFILVLFAILVSTKQYVGDPISCWCPAEFRENHVKFTNNICWVSNTYYLPMDQNIPHKSKHRDRIGYYQWVPMILLCQAVMFYLPAVVWRVLSRKSGIDINTITDAAHQGKRVTFPESREKIIRYMANHLDRYLVAQRDDRTGCWVRIKQGLAKKCCMICGRFYGNYLTALYLIVKLLYVANALGQLFMLDIFLSTDFHMYGLHVVKSLLQGQDWTKPDRFPRVTLCDFELRALGNVHRRTVQCVLPINLFNEKIYIFVWFWFALIAFLTACSWLKWVGAAIYRPGQVRYVKRQLRAMNKIDRETDMLASRFVGSYLRHDGVFIIRLVDKNTSGVVAAEILCGLWDNFLADRRIVDTRGASSGLI